jgi:nitrite reductase/ring-hydroxylating ferredoxin subunit
MTVRPEHREEPAVMTTDKISRRALGGLAAAGASLPLLAACGNNATSASDPSGTSTSAAPAGGNNGGNNSGNTGGDAGGASGGSAGGENLAKTSDIEVGGGEIFPDQEVVVTQPSSGDFKCFTAICSHQGCLVSDVSGGTINCNCHGSQYSIKDGSVVTGPATFPLAEEPITVTGDEIALNG